MGGWLSKGGSRWIGCKPGCFLHVRVLSRLFRRLFIEGLLALHRAGELAFFGDLVRLSDPQAFTAYLAPLRKKEWVVPSHCLPANHERGRSVMRLTTAEFIRRFLIDVLPDGVVT